MEACTAMDWEARFQCAHAPEQALQSSCKRRVEMQQRNIDDLFDMRYLI